MKRFLSYFFPSSLFILIFLLGLRRIFAQGSLWRSLPLNPDIVIIALYLLLIVYETKIAHTDANNCNTSTDRATREFYSISQGIVVVTALWLPPVWTSPRLLHYSGFALFVLGILLRIAAIRALGKHYSHLVRKIDNHKIITGGPYRFVRHPAYAGMIIAHTGLTIYFFNIVTLAALLFLLIPSIYLRIRIEEAFLVKIEGYSEYSEGRKRLIPFVW